MICVIASLLCAIATYASTIGGVYQVITSTDDFAAGDTIILVSYDEDKNVYVMGTYDDEEGNAFHAINIGTTTAEYLPSTITLDNVNSSGYPYEYRSMIYKTGTIGLRDIDSNFAIPSGTSLIQSPTISSNDSEKWTPFISNNDKYPFEAVCLMSSDNKYITYAPSYGFKNYGNIISPYTMLAYCSKKIKTYSTITLNSTGYATIYYGDNDVELPEGLTAYTANLVEEDETYKLTMSKVDANVIPHGSGVVLKGMPNTEYRLMIHSTAVTTASNLSELDDNMLHGTDTEAIPSSDEGKYYKLANDDTKGLGFYWGAEDGDAFTNSAHKAYLFIPSDSPASLITNFTIEEQTTSTVSIKESAEEKDANTTYNITGQRTQSPSTNGISVIKGKKIIK